MRRLLLVIFSLLIPLAFAGGYMLATENAWDTCMFQVPRGAQGVPAVCGDISSTGIATGLFFGIAGTVAWALIWALVWFESTRQAAPSARPPGHSIATQAAKEALNAPVVPAGGLHLDLGAVRGVQAEARAVAEDGIGAALVDRPPRLGTKR
jgi:hypothetical protein